jgi:hypothetical protein
MKIHRIVSGTVLLVLALGSLTTQFAQDASTRGVTSDQETRSVAIALLRTINTQELAYKYKHGSYGIWRMLLSDEPTHFQEFLTIHGLLQSNPRFGDAPEILPGWNLRLNVHPDGQGYDVLLEDKMDKEHGYAALSDERGVIREGKSLQ